MMLSKIKPQTKTVTTKIEVTTKNLKEIQLQNRKTFFEQALVNINNNPFRIVML